MKITKIYDPITSVLPIDFSPTEVPAGFPSPSNDYIEEKLDLNEHLIHHPSATYYMKVQGSSMEGAGIFDGNILVVDRSLEANHNDIVIATVNGELVVKRLYKQNGEISLLAESKNYKPIQINDETDLQIWGVVIHCINSFKSK